MADEQVAYEYHGLASAIAFGVKLKKLLNKIVPDAAPNGEKWGEAVELVELIDSLHLFEKLDDHGSGATLQTARTTHIWYGRYESIADPVLASPNLSSQDEIEAIQTRWHTCILAALSSGQGAQHVVLITSADAIPKLAKQLLNEAKGKLSRAITHVDRVDAIVFLGHQRDRFKVENTPCFQTDDLLQRAEALRWVPDDATQSQLDIQAFFEERRRRRTILIGNGINRINNDDHISWGKVLVLLQSAIASTCQPLSIRGSTVPSPIKFECLADHPASLRSLAHTTNVFSYLKGQLAKIMCGTYPDPTNPGNVLSLRYPPQSICDRLRRLSSAYIVTTNYDQILEACLGTIDIPITGNTKYLLQPTGRVVGTHAHTISSSRVTNLVLESEGRPDTSSEPVACAGSLLFHAHGIASDKHRDTICIGYEHYMGFVQHLRSRLIRQSASGREFAHRVAYLLLGIGATRGTWEELFFTTDLAIVGLGLDYEESDLWELITLRAAVLNTSETLSRLTGGHFTPNRVVYYDSEMDEDSFIDDGSVASIDDRYRAKGEYFNQKRSVFLDLNVDVRVAHGGSYTDENGVTRGQYDKCFEAILDELRAQGW